MYKDTVLEVAYKIVLGDKEGRMIEYADKDNPLSVVLGKNELIAGFEEGLRERNIGSFSFVIDRNKAFGPRYEELVTSVPKHSFEKDGEIIDGLLYVGNRINMLDNRKKKVQGTVLQINEEDVVMDFNHPLAGEELIVSGEILSIRQVDKNDAEPTEGCGCGSGCGCSSEKETEEEVYCETCGNPEDKMGQGYGDCQCG